MLGSALDGGMDLPLDIEIIGVQIPGLEGRHGDAPVSSIPILVQALADGIHQKLGKPFAFFGHSLGAFIAFELARQLRRQYQRQSVHFFAPPAGRLKYYRHIRPSTI